SACEAARHIAAGDLSAEELTRALLARIEARSATVHAWVHLDPEAAIAAARTCDKAEARGPLHGVPVAVKDIFDTADMPTRYGSPIYRDHQPTRDAVAVTRLKDAGAIVMGKSVTTEFAYFTPRETANPHNPGRTPGGSSSGSAAAVADGQVPAALGTQTSGSIIRPASFCGVFGLKPAYDDIPTDGVLPNAPSLDTVGIFARDIADLALLFAVLAGRMLPAYESVAVVDPSLPPRIGVFRTHLWDEADDAARAHFDATVAALANAGARLRDMAVPPGFEALDEAHGTIIAKEAAGVHDAHWREHRAELSDRLAALIEAGHAVEPAALAAAFETASRWRASLPRLTEPGEILLTLSTPGEAPMGLASTGDPKFNRIWTLLHVPALHLPIGTGPAGLPMGIQLVAPTMDEAHLLDVGRWVVEELELTVKPITAT
ncbi:MAG: amidase, partial [Alphaproteobacteria bacterium]|nr:amidase [Alphaproteobacteria bacterium]